MYLKLIFLIFSLIILLNSTNAMDMLGVDQNYTDINKDTKEYYGSDLYTDLSWTGLYTFTKTFMNSIMETIDPKDFLTITPEKAIQLKSDDAMEIVKPFQGVIIFAAFLIAFAVLFPVAGLIYSCCRCCGNCGSTPARRSKESDRCSKIAYGIILLVLCVGLLFCVVFSFGSTEELNGRVEDFTADLKTTTNDISTFFDNTVQQLSNLLDTNFNEFRNKTNTIIEDNKDRIIDLIEFDDTDVKNLKILDFFKHLKSIQDLFVIISNNVVGITNNIAALKANYTDIQLQIQVICGEIDDLAICDPSTVLVDFDVKDDEIPSFNTTELQKIDFSTIEDEINKIPDQIAKAKNDANQQFDAKIKEANDTLDKAGTTVQDTITTVKKTVSDMNNQIKKQADPFLDDANKYIMDYMKYVHGTMVFFSCVLLTVLVLITIGYTWGIFATVPKNNATCSTKAGGSKFFIWAVGLMFAFAFFMALMTLVFFVIGFIPDRVVCDSVDEPEKSKLLTFLNDAIDFEQFNVNVTSIVDVMNGCKDNDAMYSVFKLDSQFNLDNIITEIDVNSTMDSVVVEVMKSIPEELKIIDKKDLENLETLKDFNIALDFDTSPLYNSLQIIDDGIKKINDLTEKTKEQDIIDKIKTCLDQLTKSKKDCIDDGISLQIKTITENLEPIREWTKTLKDEVNKLNETLTNEQNKLDTKKEDVGNVTQKFVDEIKNHVQIYLNRVTDKTETELGKCKPLYQSTKSLLVTGCYKILNPMNGFWFTMFLSLLLFVPIIIVCTVLATLFQKTESRIQPEGAGYDNTALAYDYHDDRYGNVAAGMRNDPNHWKSY
ncbi:unnamed protein product [Brassicogethes aeneus]|uniref:Uncharacterized protein n=1 Tax=Brassicogethes aeneus TaxID=1431903 RepID=A0A9P0BG18_BRAAE|nr:unnamed protein product [Brassicogethes aeneus]